jgi:hypothetical protein
MEPAEENQAVLELAHKAYLDEYREHSDNWKTIEAKAQGLMTTCGIFIAAALAGAREQPPVPVIFLTAITLFLLLVTMWTALSVLKVKGYRMPFDGSYSINIANTCLMHSTEIAKTSGARLITMYRHLFDDHRKVLTTIDEAVVSKVEKLTRAYRLLLCAGVVAVITATVQMTCSKTNATQLPSSGEMKPPRA